jgi:hypothetical protein
VLIPIVIWILAASDLWRAGQREEFRAAVVGLTFSGSYVAFVLFLIVLQAIIAVVYRRAHHPLQPPGIEKERQERGS